MLQSYQNSLDLQKKKINFIISFHMLLNSYRVPCQAAAVSLFQKLNIRDSYRVAKYLWFLIYLCVCVCVEEGSKCRTLTWSKKKRSIHICILTYLWESLCDSQCVFASACLWCQNKKKNTGISVPMLYSAGCAHAQAVAPQTHSAWVWFLHLSLKEHMHTWV